VSGTRLCSVIARDLPSASHWEATRSRTIATSSRRAWTLLEPNDISEGDNRIEPGVGGQLRVHLSAPCGRSSSNQTHAPSAPETNPHRSAILLRR